ncbi:beta-1,3-galactosyl-O-glycosyl-glycoprotein beta-1,6-N-acetylglucosaminyltransferase 4 isoform X3 [Syngnathoides biaculeatus]|uniref:beta-1,3-galactosyl-O-glycosyl-glycoprotein beta-1,6-N-acetylglucosaminyltransferase 4 isoform X3 n=1 Tax=Syngnathoides biaculeatus TaxID=300417 RepID=UPI002ADE4AFD|nr:beta-1,3-galactosyl-O-glycosyl-glycoprotein beta-1,6-N-acetylglucosaminyltransferase 4 isoform X3 [Syngnathoides biaculeatus]XP_061671882.1 beta-1,3-galactosyl-O-glycosyl-glycoprotein beta-1,6-N-acetylglucosaminyltransferase 4 isoform X3 [Syngnathoides biaculeatus]XP_061671886.1 beta-1,3-galactosyl-O-glycosyl-glycoprotein beta-1,6-N-acetylglucosaminyltransferase 4 isoform X3 [Syngnathoides biaculeatus]
MYAILDNQSNRSLARSEFFKLFDIQGDHTPYLMRTCAGTTEMTGRKAAGFQIEALNDEVCLDLPPLIECNEVTSNRSEIPSPEIAHSLAHLRSMAPHIPKIDPKAQILILLGRDLIQVHKLKQSLAIQEILKEVEENQMEMSAWPLTQTEDGVRYYAGLTEILKALTEVLVRERLEKDKVTHEYKHIYTTTLQHGLKIQLLSLASRQKNIVGILQRQMDLDPNDDWSSARSLSFMPRSSTSVSLIVNPCVPTSACSPTDPVSLTPLTLLPSLIDLLCTDSCLPTHLLSLPCWAVSVQAWPPGAHL